MHHSNFKLIAVYKSKHDNISKVQHHRFTLPATRLFHKGRPSNVFFILY